MTLSLFTVFHANLAFSSIPPDDVGRVLDKCVWPLLEATKRPGVRLGLELPADSLELIAIRDPLMLRAIRERVIEGRLEIVGSGLVQAILPLIPAGVGLRNLRRGQDVYEARLNARPRIAYLHEQTYAAGLVPLYRDAGFEAIVAEWENPASAHGWPEAMRYRAAWIEGTGKARLPCLWNSSVLFQRVQRYAHGEIELDELLALLASHHDPATARTLCLYGNDVEVFDYRPGAASLRYNRGPIGEWDRLVALLDALAADRRFALVTPSAALAAHPPTGRSLRLESAGSPLPAKKQAKYNVTRWAICGRDNVRLNARCHALARRVGLVGALERAGGSGSPVSEGTLSWLGDGVVRLWGSDFRTHTTEQRAAAVVADAGALDSELDRILARLEPDVVGRPLAADEVALFNPHPTPWLRWPVAVRLAWAPGQIRGGVAVESDGRELVAQAEEVEHHQDGSWRSALVVLAPVIPPYGTLRLRCRTGDAVATPGPASDRIETASATVELASRRGAALRTLTFPRLARESLAGTVAQGAFAPIELAADWYTGNFVLQGADGAKHTDLEPTTLIALAAPESCPIRIPVAARVSGPYGELWKTIYVYRDIARVDMRYHLTLRDQRPRSLRLGMLTLDPTAFKPEALRYTTVNGGREVETFALGDTPVAQHDAVSFGVSARGCVGATEGWVDVGDAKKGITVAFDPSVMAAAPLVQHTPAGDRALTRVFLSLAESDDTAAPFFRGHTTFTVSYLGRGADTTEMRRQAVAAAHGLHVIRPEEVPDAG